MKNVKEITASMKLVQLKELIKLFNITVSDNKKASVVLSLSEYIKYSIREILDTIILYDELKLIEKIIDNEYLEYDIEEKNNQIKNSLCYLGIIYSDSKGRTFIADDLKDEVKILVKDEEIINHCKNRQKIINLFEKLLDLYGILSLGVVEDYIIDCIGPGYRVHEAIRLIQKYNTINKIYYQDNESTYYNIKILDEHITKNVCNNLNLKYKYYKINDILEFESKTTVHEKEIYFILNRYYKNSKLTNECIEDIKYLIKSNVSSEEISIIVKQKVKRLSELGRKRIEYEVRMMREYYPLWGLKGYCLKEIKQ